MGKAKVEPLSKQGSCMLLLPGLRATTNQGLRATQNKCQAHAAFQVNKVWTTSHQLHHRFSTSGNTFGCDIHLQNIHRLVYKFTFSTLLETFGLMTKSLPAWYDLLRQCNSDPHEFDSPTSLLSAISLLQTKSLLKANI